MSIRDNRDINPLLISEKQYSLAVKHLSYQTSIRMNLNTSYFHTSHLPYTYDILKSNLPTVLNTECFNDSNLPFSEEVKNTEIGHLFEHIILEYLCQLKIREGHRKALFRGVTNWNWKKDTRGTFHIFINLKPADVIYLDLALEKSIGLLNKILSNRNVLIN